MQAKTDHVDKTSYKKMHEWIDYRYKVTYGNLDYKPTSKDDPMGLALMGESRHGEDDGASPSGGVQPSPTWSSDAPVSADLDAAGKGKGKGKGDGKCHVCGGDGHFARDCPSVPPIGPQAVECLGCNGRGHYRNQCPTHNPHLKGKGKGKGQGKGWGKGGGGKGKGGKGGFKGKGKGGGGGLNNLDLMGTWNGDANWQGEQDWSDDWWIGSGSAGLNSMGSWYSKSLATLGLAPVATSNRYDPISSPTMEVDIQDLVVERRRKASSKSAKKTFAPPQTCSCLDPLCGEHPQIPRIPSSPTPAESTHRAKSKPASRFHNISDLGSSWSREFQVGQWRFAHTLGSTQSHPELREFLQCETGH